MKVWFKWLHRQLYELPVFKTLNVTSVRLKWLAGYLEFVVKPVPTTEDKRNNIQLSTII